MFTEYVVVTACVSLGLALLIAALFVPLLAWLDYAAATLAMPVL